MIVFGCEKYFPETIFSFYYQCYVDETLRYMVYKFFKNFIVSNQYIKEWIISENL